MMTMAMAKLWVVLLLGLNPVLGLNYKDALTKSILFYEGQRSGNLPPNQRLKWRSHSGLKDGFAQGVNLVGGYYDAGDNVKFGLPMAFTITMLSWSVMEYGNQIEGSGEMRYALDAIKWGADYLMKAHPEPNVLWGEVGDGFSDHYCWQRPEEMTTSRQAYRIDPSKPGSDLAGETAAALAAASIAFRHTNRAYSTLLLKHAKELFTFANMYRGKYDSSIGVARSFYRSMSGYADELLWSATWLYYATSDESYLNYVINNGASLGGTGWAMTEFSWDVKYAGVQVLVSKLLLQGKGGRNTDTLRKYQSKAEYFLCACLQKNNGLNVHRTPGGMMYWRSWNNMQYVTGASFLLTVYSDYLSSARQNLQCGGGSVAPYQLLSLAHSQVDYILGDNPRGTSYLVGFGSNYPRRVHHRAASIVSYKVNPTFVSCRGGYASWFSRGGSDPNILMGALVGGPDQNDNYADERDNYEQSEPATYNNAPMIGVLARLNGGPNFNQLFPVNTPMPSPSMAISIRQRMTGSWRAQSGPRTYYRYEAALQNNSGKRLQRLLISFKGLHGPVWGLSKTKIGTLFTFPKGTTSLPIGATLTFVYIQATPQAQLTISSATFV